MRKSLTQMLKSISVRVKKCEENTMLNVIAIQGRLARDPEMRQTTTGKSVASFTLACDRGRKDANGNSQTDWIPCTA